MTIEEIALEVVAALEARTDLTESEKEELWIEACRRLGIENTPGED